MGGKTSVYICADYFKLIW